MKKKNTTSTPHDAAFRQFLTQPEIARDFMELHLPAELRAICDLSTLKLESGSFVEDDLRQYFSDVLYSLETTEGTGYVHVLIEHQSSPDVDMRRVYPSPCLWPVLPYQYDVRPVNHTYLLSEEDNVTRLNYGFNLLLTSENGSVTNMSKIQAHYAGLLSRHANKARLFTALWDIKTDSRECAFSYGPAPS